MKTFTLRLTDDEAEALEMLAGMNKESKNSYITKLIAADFGKYYYKNSVSDGEILFIDDNINFWPSIYMSEQCGIEVTKPFERETLYNLEEELLQLPAEKLDTLIKIYRYVISNASDMELADLLKEQMLDLMGSIQHANEKKEQ